MRRQLRAEAGLSLLEVIIALGVVSLAIVVLLQVLPVAIGGTSRARAGVSLINLANSQLENLKRQTFQASYSPISPLPDGFTVAVTSSVPMTYRYPSPSFAQTADTLQLVTVTITGPYGTRSLEGYRARR